MVSIKKKSSIFLVAVLLASSFSVGYSHHSTRPTGNCSKCKAVEQLCTVSIANIDVYSPPLVEHITGPVPPYEDIFKTAVHFIVVTIRPPPRIDSLA